MSRIYELIGRLMVHVWLRRYGRSARIAAGVGLGAAVLGAIWAATRDTGEDL